MVCGRCKKYIISNTIGEISDAAEVSASGLLGLFVVGEREGAVARMVKDYKFKSVRRLANELAEVLSAAIPEEKFSGEVVVVPLPTISRHIRERGFDHTAVLAKKLAKLRGWKYSSLLLRENRTVQVGSDAEMRKKQAEGAYKILKNSVSKDKTYLLVDDVWTTGASMGAAARRIREVGAEKVYGAIVCKGMK